jgi:hypothetical protein
MAARHQLRGKPTRFGKIATVLLPFVLAFICSLPAAAQIHGIPPSVTSIPNHTPPYLPNAPASVTSLGPYGYCCTRPSNIPFRNPAFPNPYNRRRGYGGYGYGYGYSYAVPYYYVYPDEGYDTSGTSGPYLYSGPPQSQTPPGEQTLHIVVDSAPSHTAYPKDDTVEEQASVPAKQAQADVKPGVPTILVFRDGRKQQVTNYAIMGQTVYVFDDRAKKIALADLDVPATMKANDEQGVEFQLPKTKQNTKPSKSSTLPQSAPAEPQNALPDVSRSTP